jgi:hypothetical protein
MQHQALTKTQQELKMQHQEVAKKDQELEKTQQELKMQHQEVAKKDQELEKTQQELKMQHQDLTKTQQELDNAKQKLASKTLSLVQTKYPAARDRTLSGPYLSKNHLQAKVLQLDIQSALLSLEQNCLDDKFWETDFLPSYNTINCQCESSAQRFIVIILEPIIRGLRLDSFVTLVEHRSLAGSECDILLSYSENLLPFAVIEVKKPCNTNKDRNDVWYGVKKSGKEDANLVAGQLLDAMTAIQLYGFPCVCGMIATWNHWRLVGTFTEQELSDPDKSLKDMEALMKETKWEKKLQEIQERFQSVYRNDHAEEGSTPIDSPERPMAQSRNKPKNCVPRNRVIWGSKIVPSFESIPNHDGTGEDAIFDQVQSSGTDIVVLVSFFVIKACGILLDFLQGSCSSTPLLKPIILGSKIPSRVLTENSQVFAFATIKLHRVSWDVFNEKLKELYVIRHLGMGDYGNCCLAVSFDGGSCCAVKFFHRFALETSPEIAMDECANWNKVYEKIDNFPKCRVINAAEAKCLVMPYLHPIPKEKRLKLIEDGSIEKALHDFCNSGFLHLDIKWRHIGLWKNRIVLLDLGMLQKESDKKKQEAWCQDSIKKLREKAGSVVVANETPLMKMKRRRKK